MLLQLRKLEEIEKTYVLGEYDFVNNIKVVNCTRDIG